MRSYHWGMILLFLLIGYFIGVWKPAPGQQLRAAIGI